MKRNAIIMAICTIILISISMWWHSRTQSREFPVMRNSEPISTPIAWCTTSPDGQQVLLCRIRRNSRKDVFSEIWRMNVDGTGSEQISRGVADSTPDWSPDRTKLVFTSFAPLARLWIMNSDGTSRRQLTTGKKVYSLFPQWSPRGDKIAFVSHTSSGQSSLCVIDVAGKRQETLVKNIPHKLGWAWSPDGSKLFYSSENGDISALTLASGERVLLGTTPDICTALRPSPDSTRIAYTVFFSAEEDRTGVMDLRRAGKELVFPGDLSVDCWSPNGRSLIVSKRIIEGTNCYFRLCIVDLETSLIREVTKGNERDSFASFLPGGNRILFLRNSKKIMTVNTDGTNLQQVYQEE